MTSRAGCVVHSRAVPAAAHTARFRGFTQAANQLPPSDRNPVAAPIPEPGPIPLPRHREKGERMSMNAGLFSSETDEWPTPVDLFAALDAEFEFTLDPCASPDNAKCATFYTIDDDGLSQDWPGAVFMNPPYGRQIGEWVAKAWTESLSGSTVVCLIPARTDTHYWHDYVMRASELRFIRQRLHFDNARHQERLQSGAAFAHNAPFPSVVVVFRPGHAGYPAVSTIERDGRQRQERGAA